MKITRAADYAIRLLAHLASGRGEGTSEALAKKLDIPFNHLAKLVQILARRGYLVTTKGKGGGLRLAVDPKKIDLTEVIEAIEGPLLISDCLFHRESCRFSPKCKFRRTLAKAKSRMNSVLSETTIFDLAAT
jgi:Rrf2 family nitric oxide-sensitive transcriptional repressor